MTEIKQIPCGMVNTYLLKGKNGAVLVDTGETADREKVLKACENENVRLLLLTHGHIDHIQNGAYLARKLHVPIAMHQKDAELIRNQFAQALEGTGLFGKILAAASRSKMKKNQIEPFDPELFLREGDSLEPYGVQASVMELPGHTKGSIGLDVEGRAVIVGDALMHMLRPGAASIYADREKLKESAKRITALGNRTIYFGHGTPVPNREWKR
ncbi:MBL fold metallo-hydrolase [Schaedlerella sp.]|uniref:MBL fold metallo-hydrolase n=1 Tax=Schaedlerella sp. TaxID=2676057 RepID=UPI0013640D30|nr:MBL fold metallo-hydrolase [Lachnospiraceae bacterium]